MDLPEYKQCLARVRNSHGNVTWHVARLRPLYDTLGELNGWKLTWVGTFENNHFVRIKEHWQGVDPNFERKFFSYHYGPYEAGWNLETVKCKAVVVRVDAVSYHGRGYHIHDGAKDRRIHQDSLKSPQLRDMTVPDFLVAVEKLRLGQTVQTAFRLEEQTT